jgi:hypothetical protein
MSQQTEPLNLYQRIVKANQTEAAVTLESILFKLEHAYPPPHRCDAWSQAYGWMITNDEYWFTYKNKEVKKRIIDFLEANGFPKGGYLELDSVEYVCFLTWVYPEEMYYKDN